MTTMPQLRSTRALRRTRSRVWSPPTVLVVSGTFNSVPERKSDRLLYEPQRPRLRDLSIARALDRPDRHSSYRGTVSLQRNFSFEGTLFSEPPPTTLFVGRLGTMSLMAVPATIDCPGGGGG
jgi:hypothetical protein